MTDMTTTPTPDTSHLRGTTLTWLRTGFAYSVPINAHYETRFTQRGDEAIVTPALIEALTNRKGCILDLDEQGQIDRLGYQLFVWGPKPASVHWWTPGNAAEKQIAYDRDRKQAWATVDPEERALALNKLRKTYGTMVTSTVIQTMGS
jgi:hypothetical protein